MFLICEQRHRYLGNYTSEVILGYVKTEGEAKKICDENGIKYQMNKYISGGNDSANIQKSIGGVRVGLLSAASRYIHSQANVVKYSDLESILDIGIKLISDEPFLGGENK